MAFTSMIEDSNCLSTRVGYNLEYWVEVLECKFKTEMTQELHDLCPVSVEVLSHVLVKSINI